MRTNLAVISSSLGSHEYSSWLLGFLKTLSKIFCVSSYRAFVVTFRTNLKIIKLRNLCKKIIETLKVKQLK